MCETSNQLLEILVVDDDDVVTRLHRYALQNLVENPVLVFGNGDEALSHLEKKHGKNKKFLVLLDLNMPVLNGWEFLEALQRRAYNLDIYVVILTSSSYRNDYMKSQQFPQVVGFYTKPLNKDSLIDILELGNEASGNNEKVVVRRT